MTTREEWLDSAVEVLNGWIADRTALTPAKKVQVSTGWPRHDRGGKVIGQCFAKKAAGGKAHHIFISPMLSKPTDVLATLLHELIHAADDCESQHGGAFAKAARAVGFTGKMTTTPPTPELLAELKVLAKELGKYPHVKLTPSEKTKTQSTRMLKVQCVSCGCIARMTRKWLDEAGCPTCACGNPMEEEQ